MSMTSAFGWPAQPLPSGLERSIAPDGAGCHRAKRGEGGAKRPRQPRRRRHHHSSPGGRAPSSSRPGRRRLTPFRSFRSYVLSASDRPKGGPRGLHVRHVSLQQPPGVTRSGQHNGDLRDPAQRPGPALLSRHDAHAGAASSCVIADRDSQTGLVRVGQAARAGAPSGVRSFRGPLGYPKVKT
jgi:hypothetical protein